VHYKRRAVQAVAGFVLGVGLLLGGVISQYIWVGVAGFVVMLVCSMWALTSYRHINATSTAAGFGRPRRSKRARRRQQRQQGKAAGIRVAQPGMMERLEERWRRRQEGGL
ncbi:MAG TPA: DUF3040 domain-containing protein, partial [Streptosporangiaceae bacterium]